jgi:hypothetical protein
MTYFQAQDLKVKFVTRIAFSVAVFLALAILATGASADQFEDLGKKLNEVVDDEGNVHFPNPLNQVQRGAHKSDDELAIIRLEAEYQAAIDDAADDQGKPTARLEDYANLWTEDGTYISDLVSIVAGFNPALRPIVEDGNKVQGRENLEKMLEILEQSGVNGKRHLLSGVRVQFITPKLAIGQSEFAIIEAAVVPAVVIATGRYHSVYKKVEDKWLFRQRKQDVDKAWGPASGQPINSMQDIVFDLKKRVEQLEAQIKPK